MHTEQTFVLHLKEIMYVFSLYYVIFLILYNVIL